MWRQQIAWRRMQARAMSRDFSWTHSAAQYRDLYLAMANVPVAAAGEDVEVDAGDGQRTAPAPLRAARSAST